MALRSLLSRYRSLSRPSVFSGGSSTYSSVAKKQISAEDAIIDDQYDQGNLSAESYLTKLKERLIRPSNTPLQVQNLNEKVRNVQIAVTDAEVANAYQKGDITTADMYSYEKSKLDNMTEPTSETYIKQQQKVNGLLDKAEREARADARTAEMLRISQMPEDNSEKIWAKVNLYDQLEQQARLDGDTAQADQLAIQKNNYTSSAKRADINDLITGTKLQTSETFGAGIGVPSAEGGASLYSELTGGGAPGVTTPAVKNALESLDRQKKTLDRLYQSRDDKGAMVSTYEQAVNAASGDQKTQLTIALNNLKNDIVSIDNQISNTTQNITDTVYRVQELNQKAAASTFKQEVRKENAKFDRDETDLENEFKNGKIDKIEYITKGIELAQTKAMYYEQVSNGFSQFGDDMAAQSYLDKTNEATDIHESLVSVAQNLDDYEPIMVDKDSNLTNLFGQKVRKGDVVLQDVRQIKDSGRFNENYANVDGVYHRIQYEGLPSEFLDPDGFLISGISGDKNAAKFLDNAYVYTVKDGKVGTEKIKFIQSDNGVEAVPESKAQKWIDSGQVIKNQQGSLIQKPQMQESGVMKTLAGIEQLPGIKQAAEYTRNLPQAYKEIGQKYVATPVQKVMDYYRNFYTPIINKGVEGAKSIFQKGKEFASTAISKAKDLFKGMNIFNPPEVSGQEVQNPYSREIAQAFGNEAQDAMRVLRYADESGKVKGENTGFQTGTEVDIPNNDGSIDRGLFRINSNTFADFMRRKGKLLAQYGIRTWDDMLNPQKNSFMAKIIKDEQGWKAWYAAPEDLRGGEYAPTPASRSSADMRTRNIELALNLPKGSYKKGMNVDQEAINRAYRSNDNEMIKLMQEEGFNPVEEALPTATPTPVQQRPSTSSGGGGSAPASSWSMPKIEVPKINVPQIAQKATTAIKNYFTPEYNAGKNFWSTPVAQSLGNVQTAIQKVTQPVTNTVQKAVSSAKSWISNLFKRK